MALGAIFFFFSGALFLEENMDHTETFFSGMGLFYIFLGLIIECVIRTPKMNHVFIYIYRSCFLED